MKTAAKKPAAKKTAAKKMAAKKTAAQKPADFAGILPIVSVPFTRSQAVDYDGFTRTLRYLNATDCFGMMLFGIASEFYKLSDYEKSELARRFLAFPTRKKKFLSVTDHAAHLAVQKAKRWEAMGADGLMLLPPFFLQPPKEDILAHIRRVLGAVSIPVLLQVAATETGTSYAASELAGLQRDFPHVIFKIESSPIPAALIARVLREDPSARVFNGYAGVHMLEALELGCAGIMPGCSATALYTRIYDLYAKGDRAGARSLHARLLPFIGTWMTSCEYIIKMEKHLLMRQGVIESDACREPTYDMSAEDYKAIEKFFSEFSEFDGVQPRKGGRKS